MNRIFSICLLSLFTFSFTSTLQANPDPDDEFWEKDHHVYTPEDPQSPQTSPGMEDTKQRAAEYSAIGFGPATLRNIVSRDLAYSFFFGRIWEVNPYAGIRLIVDATTDFRNSVLSSVSMGLNLTPFEEEVMPYIAAEFGLGYGREENSNLFGFNAAAGVGFILFRSATVQMIVEGKAGFIFDDIANGFPTLYTVRIGINY